MSGLTSAQIAQLLAISLKSVATYRGRLMAKIGVRNASALLSFAIERGLTHATRKAETSPALCSQSLYRRFLLRFRGGDPEDASICDTSVIFSRQTSLPLSGINEGRFFGRQD